MKNSKVTIYEWIPEWGQENIEIDWPAVQRSVGEDTLKWIMKQDFNDCQLMLEQSENEITNRLVVEFYNPDLLVKYHLMFS